MAAQVTTTMAQHSTAVWREELKNQKYWKQKSSNIADTE